MWFRYLFSKERTGKKGQVYGSLLEALQKSKTTNIHPETAVLKYIKEVSSQRTYPDPPILSQFCKKQIVQSLKTFKSLKSTWFQRI
jgi:hypothetical protein